MRTRVTTTSFTGSTRNTAPEANAGWQHDLWVSYETLANHCEKLNQAAEAKAWWRKAYETLAGMKERGLHMSSKDLAFLERLRGKVEKYSSRSA